MKGIAFALDPDGYWIELVKRGENRLIIINYCYHTIIILVIIIVIIIIVIIIININIILSLPLLL